jgi:hypothetical protein
MGAGALYTVVYVMVGFHFLFKIHARRKLLINHLVVDKVPCN